MTPSDIEKRPYRPCVGIMLVNGAGHVFVGQRVETKAEAWQMPQGGIDDGETPRDAALRELNEETGVAADLVDIKAETADWVYYDLPPEIAGKIWNGRYRGQKQLWFLMRFRGDDSDIDIATKHPEFSEWTWLDPTDLVAKIVPFKREVYAAVLAEFEPHLT